MAPSHWLSNLLLGQAGGSEFGAVGNDIEFTEWFWKHKGYKLHHPVAYIKCDYKGGHSQHKLDLDVPGYLVLTRTKLVFFSSLSSWHFDIPLGKIQKNLMFVEAKGFTRLSLTSRNRDKFLKILESMDIAPEGKKILQALPEQAAAVAKQRYSKKDINSFVNMVVNLAVIIKKRTLTIPYESSWGLEKPKFYLGIFATGLDEFIYEWAKLGLKK